MMNNPSDSAREPARSKVRILVFLLIFFAIAINYMDRVNFSVAVPAIEKQFGFNIAQIGEIAFAWTLTYAVFNFPGGWIADKLKLRNAFSLAIGWWSIFTILTAVAYSFSSWIIIRGLMGVGEAPVWPLNAKATSTWAAPGERSTTYTMPGSGQFVGPAVGSVLSGLIVASLGWQWAFIIFGLLGLAWVPIWYTMVRDTPETHPWVNQAELRYIQGASGALGQSAVTREDMRMAARVMTSRNGIGVFLTFLTFGYILFTFLYWLPSYMYFTFHLSIVKSAAWSSISYGGGFLGFMISGPINDRLIRRYGNGKGRKIGSGVPMVLMIIMMLIAVETSKAHAVIPTVVLIGLSLMAMNSTVGSWAVNAIDLAPNPRSTAFVYGIYNGVLNLMGAANSIILTRIAGSSGFIAAFSSAILFMVVFLVGLIFVIDHRGVISTKERLLKLNQ